ncbi:hypothetical protein [Paracidovorax sp. MALMAid1276]|uniref:hypothetical protein n=1 Tax=Paracidovorax sp. MALMAid1276 TaxID=3411631 RepID=UPI003B9B7CE8
MPAKKPTIVVVDTNCFIRLMFSPLRPVLGSVVGGYQLMTLANLAKECGPGTEVVERNPWLLAPEVQEELTKNCLSFREPKTSDVRKWAKTFLERGNPLLRAHCIAKNLDNIRELSRADVTALAAAQVLGSPLATDEWPLTWAAERVSDVEVLLTSVALIHLMEKDGKITREQRVDIVTTWVKHGEKLPANWRAQYRELFQDEPPDGQA